ncbi:hypothetical protein [Saccharothrix sp. Mg75]|uniref:hypothetical protein n=1 Tax=Saccharothrix sp. Mg75 TaxID=3445357 RepID=UPI003EEB718F
MEADEVDLILAEPAPEDPGGLVDFLATEVLSRSLSLGHPGCFAFIPGANNFLGDLLVSGFNVSPGAWFIGAGPVAVEQVTARWLAELLGLPAGSCGVFTPVGRWPT